MKLSGKCPSVQPRALSCSSSSRAEHAGLHAREARGLVDREHPVQPADVDRDDRARLVRRRLEAARDVRAAAERDHDGVGRRAPRAGPPPPRPRRRGGRRRRAAGRGRRAGGARGRAGSCRARARRGRARRSRRARRRPRPRAPRAGPVGSAGSGTSQVAEGDRRGDVARSTSSSRWRWMNGPELGLVLVREGDVLVAPSPPLHAPEHTRSAAAKPIARCGVHGVMGDGRLNRAIEQGKARTSEIKARVPDLKERVPGAQGARTRARRRAAHQGHRAAHARRRARAPVREDGRLVGALRLRARGPRRHC